MHRTYARIVPGAGTAVLMVHGIVGTPRQFDFLLETIPEDVSVLNVLCILPPPFFHHTTYLTKKQGHPGWGVLVNYCSASSFISFRFFSTPSTHAWPASKPIQLQKRDAP